MNKIYAKFRIIEVMQCFYEMELNNRSLKGFQWLKAVRDFWIGNFLFFIILTISICIGYTKIPYYMGDGYDFDIFK